jgi:hypothetical protein
VRRRVIFRLNPKKPKLRVEVEKSKVRPLSFFGCWISTGPLRSCPLGVLVPSIF